MKGDCRGLCKGVSPKYSEKTEKFPMRLMRDVRQLGPISKPRPKQV